MDILLTVRAGNIDRRLGWLSLQPDGSVSVGLSDKTFVSPDFKAQNFVWSVFNRETLHYLIESDPRALTPIRNPHLTFHPPHDFHLKANGGRTLFEGIGDLSIMLQQDGTVPWIRFVSKTVAKLSTAGLPRNPGRTKLVAISLGIEDCSIGFGIDFVLDAPPTPDAGALLDEWIPWQTYYLHLHAVPLPPQIPTLSWFHQR